MSKKEFLIIKALVDEAEESLASENLHGSQYGCEPLEESDALREAKKYLEEHRAKA
jgi:hypothetical protein